MIHNSAATQHAATIDLCSIRIQNPSMKLYTHYKYSSTSFTFTFTSSLFYLPLVVFTFLASVPVSSADDETPSPPNMASPPNIPYANINIDGASVQEVCQEQIQQLSDCFTTTGTECSNCVNQVVYSDFVNAWEHNNATLTDTAEAIDSGTAITCNEYNTFVCDAFDLYNIDCCPTCKETFLNYMQCVFEEAKKAGVLDELTLELEAEGQDDCTLTCGDDGAFELTLTSSNGSGSDSAYMALQVGTAVVQGLVVATMLAYLFGLF